VGADCTRIFLLPPSSLGGAHHILFHSYVLQTGLSSSKQRTTIYPYECTMTRGVMALTHKSTPSADGSGWLMAPWVPGWPGYLQPPLTVILHRNLTHSLNLYLVVSLRNVSETQSRKNNTAHTIYLKSIFVYRMC
jgi:hypothetical protein